MYQNGPPSRVIHLGHYTYPCTDQLVCKVDIKDVPYFNAPIYLENKTQIGKVDEIFGTLHDFYITVKLLENMSVTSVKPKQDIFIDPARLLPLERFLPKPPQPAKSKTKKRNGNVTGSGDDRAAASAPYRGAHRGASKSRGGRNFEDGGGRGRGGGSFSRGRGGGFNNGRGGVRGGINYSRATRRGGRRGG